MGAIAAGVHYIGTDIDHVTVDGNRRLAAAIGATDVEVIQAAAETFDAPNVDLVFTSPPYFDRERYSQADGQSWKKHGEGLDTWVDGFLRPVIQRAHKALSIDSYLVLNIDDLRERKVVIPLVARTIETAVSVGFNHVETLLMPLAAINRKSPSEPVLVFQKA
jgi:tRNA G10  N-methylase Trm11